MRSKIAQEILDEMEPKHSDLVREYGALWLENDQQAIQIKALKEQLQAAAESLRLHKELVEELSWVEDEIDTAREWMKVHKGENSRYLQIQEENTRLRELLTKAKDYIFLGYVGAVELSDEIDNALNPKP